MFGKKKNVKKDQPIPKNTEKSILPDNIKSGLEKVNESRKESKMANLTSGVDIKGTINFGETMRIDGNFEGELISDNGELIVGKTGNVKANIKVRSLVVEGRVDGNIKASDKIELKQNAHLTGDLQAKTLVVEKGVVFVGKCNVDPGEADTKSQSYKKSLKEITKEERVKEITFNRFINV
jgi:cytoskeletal protein CcmA (bactofilin family)